MDSTQRLVDSPLDGSVSHYRVLEKLGGGMGVVYKAEDLKLGHRAPDQGFPRGWPW